MSDLKNILVKHLAGSHAYGTNTPESDVDYRGIFYTPIADIYSPFKIKGEQNDSNEEDTKFYELRKYINLYVKCNPNIVETLWVENSDITFKTNVYDMLRSEREALLCSKVAFTYTGYAHNQKSRMSNHYNHMKEGTPKPHQVDYCGLIFDFFGTNISKFNLRNYLYGYRLVPLKDNVYGLFEEDGYTCWNTHDGSLKKENPSSEFYNKKQSVSEMIYGFLNSKPKFGTKKIPCMIIKFNQKEFDDALTKYNNLKTWEANRNPTRHAMEVQHGFDLKHALHTVRLLRTAEEILTTGKVLVKRPDAQELLDIRSGSMTFDDVMNYFDEKDAYIRNVLYKQTALPRDMNIKHAEMISSELHHKIYNGVIKDTTGK